MRVEELIDQLERKIRDARETPLIGGARIDTTELNLLLAEIHGELVGLTTPLDEERYVRRAAGVSAPLQELLDLVQTASRGRVTARMDREPLLALVRRMREGTRREEIVPRVALERAPYDPAPALALVDEAERILATAPKVPLVDDVRIDREEMYDVIDRMRATFPEVAWAAQEPVKTRVAGVLPVIDELDDHIHEARPVPLTDQVRVNPGKLSGNLRRIRAAFSQGTLLALTN